MSKGLFQALSRLTRIPVRIFVRPHRRINAAMWDTQYALGLWSYLDGMSDGTVPLSLIESWAPRPTILDLGCGTSANLPLTPGRYRHYHGVDISRQAIAQARALARPDTSFEVADIRHFRSTDRYDAILLREVIYYLSGTESVALLRRLPTLLTPRGRIVVQVYDVSQTEEFVRLIRNCGLPLVAEIPTRLGDGPTGALFVLAAPALPTSPSPGELTGEAARS
ncbi:class I SAM-dependent methyltransferase [Micromonospora sp. NPDC050417]|uniref:class I SAM-dependent methyltransferase n=1 Tax=Micromonospora sp. NPDC050417 TaxID=3364280 RepID=UPI0037AC7917